jgi:hypothetical protein
MVKCNCINEQILVIDEVDEKYADKNQRNDEGQRMLTFMKNEFGGN